MTPNAWRASSVKRRCAFASDPERLARFEREAKVLASLNHPNIGAIYGLETSGDTRALVLELVEGPTCPLGTSRMCWMARCWRCHLTRERRTITGGPVPLVEGVAQGASGIAQLAHADNGSLVYQRGGEADASLLVWVDREGQEEPLPLAPAPLQLATGVARWDAGGG